MCTTSEPIKGPDAIQSAAARRRACAALSLAALLLLPGCFATASPRAYGPQDADEEQIFRLARRDIFPRDVRNDVASYRSLLLLWSGIIVDSHVQHYPDGDFLELLIEHHYWDWTENYSDGAGRNGAASVFLSPRGEGFFGCSFPVTESNTPSSTAQVQEMAIVYGVPDRVTDDGIVVLDCAVLRSLKKEYYTTDVRNYGRDWLLKGDRSDLKILTRAPR